MPKRFLVVFHRKELFTHVEDGSLIMDSIGGLIDASDADYAQRFFKQYLNAQYTWELVTIQEIKSGVV